MALNTHVSDTAANAAADAVAPLMNDGYLRLYNGAQPANANSPVTTQVLAATLRFSATAFGAAAGGVITANPIASDTNAAATATVTWFRVVKADGTTVVLDGSIADSATGNANMIIASTAIAAGTTVACTSFTHTLIE